MSRTIVVLLSLAAVVLCGCPADDAKPVDVGQIDPPVIDTPDDGKQDNPLDGSPGTDENIAPPVDATPADNSPAKIPPVDFSDIPPAPAGFTGEDQDADAPIPPEIQRKLQSYDEGRIARLIELLNYPHPAVRRQAIKGMYSLDEDDDEGVPIVVQALRGALKDPDPGVRQEGVNHLARFGTRSKNALPELAVLLHDEDKDVVDSCLYAIGRIGPDAAPLVPTLVALLKKKDYVNRNDLIDALGDIGPASQPAVPQLAKILEDTHSDRAAIALGRIGAERELLQALSSDNQYLRQRAAQGAELLSSHSPKMVRLLIKMATSDEYEYGRAHAAEALGAVRPSTTEIVAALGKALQDEQYHVRQDAAKAMGQLEPALDEAIPFLLAASKDESDSVREAATTSLGNFKGSPETRLNLVLDQLLSGVAIWSGPEDALKKGASEFYPLLRAMAIDDKLDEARRGAVIVSLRYLRGNDEFLTDEIDGELGELAASLLSADHPATVRGAAAMLYHHTGKSRDYHRQQQAAFLAGLSDAKYRQVREDAALILAHKRVKAAIPGLIEMLKGSDPELRDRAIDGLGNFRQDATDAIAPLIALAENPDIPKRYNAIHTIGTIGTQPRLSQPALLKLLDDEEKSVRASSATALAKVIAQNDLDAQPAIAKILALYDADKLDARSLVDSLETLGPKGAAGVDRLVSLLSAKKSEYLKDDVADALGAIGPDAKAAAPALIEAAVTWEDEQYYALNALAKIKAGGAQFAAVAPKLLENISLRSSTLDALAAMGPEAAAAAPAAAALLASEENSDRAAAARALGGMGQVSKSYLPKLKQIAVEDKEDYVRRAASDALLAIAPEDPEVLEAALAGAAEMRDREITKLLKTLGDRAPAAVANALKSDKPQLRLAAVRLLPEVTDNQRATPWLQAALEDEEASVRQRAALHLHAIGHTSPKMIAIFVDSLGDDGNWELHNALQEQGRLAIESLIDVVVDPAQEEATIDAALSLLDNLKYRIRIPKTKLLTALKSDNVATRAYAAIALAYADPKDHSALPVLVAALKQEHEARQVATLQAIGRLRFQDDRYPPQVSAALVACLANENEEVSREASYAIMHWKLDDAQLPVMLELLGDDTRRGVAVIALRRGALVDAQLIPPLVTLLRSADRELQEAAQDALLNQGIAAKSALLEVVFDDTAPAASRAAAGDVLLSLEIEQTDVERMASLLETAPPAVGQRAAVLLARWGHSWEPLQARLLQAVQAEGAVRNAAQRVMRDRPDDLRGAKDELLKWLHSGDEHQSRLAAELLVASDPSPEVAGAIAAALLKAPERQQDSFAIALLSDASMRPAGRAAILKAAATANDDEQVKLLNALLRLSKMPTAELTAEIALTRAAMRSDNEVLQRQAAITLAHLDSNSSEPVAILVRHVLDSEGRIDYSVHSALSHLGPKAKEAVPALMKLLEEEGNAHRALRTLAAIGPEAAVAVPRAIELLAEERTFEAAAELLGSVGPTASNAAPVLIAQLDNPRRMRKATAALAKMETPNSQLLPALYKHMKHPHLRYDAVAALGELGERGAETLPVLNRALQLGDPELTVAAAGALGQLESVAADSADELVQAFANEDDKVRGAAARALGRIAAQPDVSVPALIQALSDEDRDVRYFATEALGRFKAEASPAVGVLGEALSDEHLQATAARALGEIGPAAAQAVPQLVKLHETSNPHRKRVCATALWKIAPAAAKKAGAQEPAD